MKRFFFATTIALTATVSTILGAAAPASRAFEDAQPLSFQKTASETAHEATDPRFQKEKPTDKSEVEVGQSKGHRRGFSRRGFGRRGH